MMDFTLSNCKDLDVRKGTCGITKRFAILLVMMVMITSKALAGASFEVIDGFKYILDSDTKTATLVPNTEKYAGDVVIPESVKAKDGNDYTITAIGDRCFDCCSGLTSITIPSSVTSLGMRCFSGCSGLTSITIPSSVTSLGESCFIACESLASITIPSSVTSLGKSCFYNCIGLTSITIPSSVTSLGEWCFNNCYSLTSITIPSSVTSLGKYCFSGCNGLTSITIPSSVTSLGEACFYCCSALTSITIPSSVTSLGERCFNNCRSLTSITIPSSVTSLGSGCFRDCSSLTSITIPSSVTSLGGNCFSGSGLTSITIPSSVTSLGGYCFADCTNLESIYFKGKCSYFISNAEIPKACIIYVPAEYLQDYKDALGADYKFIYTWNPNESGDDDKPVTPCATPSVFYGAGKLKFSCETAGAMYHYTISDKDMATDALSEDGNVFLSAAYDISVYATADGYKTSEKAKATLYWVNANLENATNINQTRTRGVVASAHDGIVSISGLDNGEVVKFYAADGKLIGSSSAVDGTASCAVSETMVIAKFGDNAIKVAVK
ncbi:leucine-rich repeat domain-containing protein [Segatella copri]|uniref:leucine-rich repeat domain-containing protein n=1 Tax=Segatella copri TaxID=165179 RepID=UPI001C477769|nr:leucine-rich repeat domain-containing protein [Segatella copri]MBW0031815.1 leucine-rich repeat domain-containing protein [Segatella copri]